MYRMAVEYMAQSEGVPQAEIYRQALDRLLASLENDEGFKDYCKRHADGGER
jgi:hypothetical protein